MIEFTGQGLTIEQVVDVARNGAKVAPLSDEVRARMQRSHQWVLEAIEGQGRIIYGVNTGFGSLANRQISAGRRGSFRATWSCSASWASATRCRPKSSGP